VILLIEMNVKQTVFINLPAEEIFAYMSDLENLVDWCSAIIAVRKISPGAIHVGTMGRSTIRFLGRWADLAFEIVEYDPGRSITIKGISGAAPCLFCYQFEPGEEGGTTIFQEAVIHLAEGILAQAKPVITSAVRRQLEYDLLTLKDVLEASAVTEGSAGEWRRTLS
jgi:dehydrogenase/reductase SDR family member 12